MAAHAAAVSRARRAPARGVSADRDRRAPPRRRKSIDPKGFSTPPRLTCRMQVRQWPANIGAVGRIRVLLIRRLSTDLTFLLPLVLSAPVRATGEAPGRTTSTDFDKIAAYIKVPDFELAGFRGRNRRSAPGMDSCGSRSRRPRPSLGLRLAAAGPSAPALAPGHAGL